MMLPHIESENTFGLGLVLVSNIFKYDIDMKWNTIN